MILYAVIFPQFRALKNELALMSVALKLNKTIIGYIVLMKFKLPLAFAQLEQRKMNHESLQRVNQVDAQRQGFSCIRRTHTGDAGYSVVQIRKLCRIFYGILEYCSQRLLHCKIKFLHKLKGTFSRYLHFM